MRTGVEGCGVVAWFGKYTDIASPVLLFGFTIPAYIRYDSKPNQQLRLSGCPVIDLVFEHELENHGAGPRCTETPDRDKILQYYFC